MPEKRSPAWIIGRGIIILLLSGLAGATLVRLAPGFGLGEEALDARLSAQSLKALEREHEGEPNPLVFYGHFLAGLLRGDAGHSVVFGQPIGPLLRDRAPTTIHTILGGLAMGWAIAILSATVGALSGRATTVLVGMAISGSLLSIPSAVLATVCLLLRLSPAVAVALVIFPRVFPHTYEQIRASRSAPHVVMARARGVARTRLFIFHIAPPALAPLIALAGVSVTLAFGASIPIEALADSPGIGHLAWRAALGRDLPVLVSVTLLLTGVTVLMSVLADLVLVRLGKRAA